MTELTDQDRKQLDAVTEERVKALKIGDQWVSLSKELVPYLKLALDQLDYKCRQGVLQQGVVAKFEGDDREYKLPSEENLPAIAPSLPNPPRRDSGATHLNDDRVVDFSRIPDYSRAPGRKTQDVPIGHSCDGWVEQQLRQGKFSKSQ